MKLVSVTAAGSAPGSQFALTSGANLLPYEVQWNASSGQSSGFALSPNFPRTGLVTAATQQTCNSGPPASASLTVVIRSAALTRATAGDYTGTLQVTIAPE